MSSSKPHRLLVSLDKQTFEWLRKKAFQRNISMSLYLKQALLRRLIDEEKGEKNDPTD